MIELAGFSGSLRRASSSTALLAALSERVAARARISRVEIASLPHYDADGDGGPEAAALIARIGSAAGLVFVTPEYNYSVPGVLKNAIDWASRPAYRSVFRDKPCLVISVSGGALGGVRAQAHLKYILNGMLARVFPWQEIVVPHAPAKLVEGRFADEATLDFAGAALDAFIESLSAS